MHDPVDDDHRGDGGDKGGGAHDDGGGAHDGGGVYGDGDAGHDGGSEGGIYPGTDVEGDVAEAKRSRALELSIGGFSAVLLILIVASIHLSTLDVSFGSMVFGSKALWQGHSAGFRVTAYDPRGFDLVGPVSAELSLRDDSGVLATAEGIGATVAQLRIDIPDELIGDVFLDVEVETPLGSDSLSIPAYGVHKPVPLQGTVVSHTEVYAKNVALPSGPIRVALYPHGGQLVSGIENMVSARITKGGQPLATSIDTDAFGIHAQSDASGIFHFPFTPMPPPRPLSFAIGETENVEIPLEVASTGLLLEVTPRGLVEPGTDIKINIRTLPFSDNTVRIDVWAGGTLLLATSQQTEDRTLDIEMGIPADVEGFIRVEASRNLGDDSSRSTQLLWASKAPPEQAALAAIEALARLSGSDPIVDAALAATGDARVELTRMALTRYVPSSSGAPVLASTLEHRSETVDNRKSSLRAGVHTLFVLTVLLGLGLIIGWVIRHQSGVKRGLRQVMEEGIAAGEDIDTDSMHRLARISHLYDLVLALAAVGLIFYGILMLMLRIRWEW